MTHTGAELARADREAIARRAGAEAGRCRCANLDKPAEKPVHVHDLHATMLNLMGIDIQKLTYRLTEVVKGVLS